MYFSLTIVTYVSSPRRRKDKTAIRIARTVTRVEIAPVRARPPVEKRAPRSGVKRVVPQVGQPAPRAIKPVIIPALPRLSALCSRFFFHNRTISPIKVPCKMQRAKIGSQSRKALLKPKMFRKESPIILRQLGKPRADISSNFEKPAERRFIKSPKKRKLVIKPYQKRFSLVASKMPLPAKVKSSKNFLQFITLL